MSFFNRPIVPFAGSVNDPFDPLGFGYDWPMVRPTGFFGPSLTHHHLNQIQRRQDHFRQQMQEHQNAIDRMFSMLEKDPAFTAAANMPSMQITSDDTTSAVKLDVPGMDLEDMDIQVDDENRLVTVTGKRETNKDGTTSVQQFTHSFQLDDRTRLGELKATLENGVLTLTAPKDPEKKDEAESKLRSIPIQLLGESDKKQMLRDKAEMGAAGGKMDMEKKK